MLLATEDKTVLSKKFRLDGVFNLFHGVACLGSNGPNERVPLVVLGVGSARWFNRHLVTLAPGLKDSYGSLNVLKNVRQKLWFCDFSEVQLNVREPLHLNVSA